jgi:hypothetical protein
MASIVDNLIAYRVLSMLVKPFIETDAYKLGIIDEKGQNLIKSRDLKTQEQKDAYTYLHRLVFNLKKLLMKLPGGDSMLKNLVAAFFLVKENYSTRTTTVSQERLEELINMIDSGVVLAEEQLIVEEFLLVEDAVANVAGAGVSTDAPVIRRKPKRFGRFTVNDEVYNRFSNGKAKYRKWSSYLNLEDDGERTIYEFARKNPNGVIILHNGKNTKAIRFNRNGGGSWSKLKRPSKQINNDVVT